MNIECILPKTLIQQSSILDIRIVHKNADSIYIQLDKP